MFIKPESQTHQTAQSVLKLAVSSGPPSTSISPMANLKRRQESPSSGSDSTPPAHHFNAPLPLTNTFLSSSIPSLFEYPAPEQHILSPQHQHQQQQQLQQSQLPLTVTGSAATAIDHQFPQQHPQVQTRVVRHTLSPPVRQRQSHSNRSKRARTAAPMAGHHGYGSTSGQPQYNMYTTAPSNYPGGSYTATTSGPPFTPVTGSSGAGVSIGLVAEPPVSASGVYQTTMQSYTPFPPDLPPQQEPPIQIEEIRSLDGDRKQRRREQNRDAQKNFRERQKKDYQELQNKVGRLESELQTKDADIVMMRTKLDQVEQENEQLRRQLITHSSERQT